VGQITRSSIEVIKVESPKTIEMINNAGAIAYHSMYRLISEAPGETEVVSMLQFDIKSLVLDLARPVIEAMAESRLRGNLEMLKVLLEA
jgi:hypothetical protein